MDDAPDPAANATYIVVHPDQWDELRAHLAAFRQGLSVLVAAAVLNFVVLLYLAWQSQQS